MSSTLLREDAPVIRVLGATRTPLGLGGRGSRRHDDQHPIVIADEREVRNVQLEGCRRWAPVAGTRRQFPGRGRYPGNPQTMRGLLPDVVELPALGEDGTSRLERAYEFLEGCFVPM